MKEKFGGKWEQAAFWLLCAIVFDCAALGGGTIIELFGIDIRMILYVLFFAASLPCVLRNLKGLLGNVYFILLVLWGIWTLVATVRGLTAGNDFGRILSAWIGFASFGILPGAICILKEKGQIRILMQVISAAAFFVAIQTMVVLMVYNWMDLDRFMDLNLFIIREELGGCTGVNDAVVRIFFRSHPLVVVGCASSLCLVLTERKPGVKWLYVISIAFCLFSLLISYTRSVYLCVFVCAASVVALLLITGKKAERKSLLAYLAKATGIFVVLLLVCDLVFGGAFLSYGIYRTVGVDVLNRVEVRLGVPSGSLGGGFDLVLPEETEQTESTEQTEDSQQTSASEESIPEETSADVKKPVTNENGEFDPTVNVNAWSDNIRQMTVQELYQRIREHPIAGSGMGASLAVRAGLDGNNEYFFLDMTFKTGLIGTLLYVAPILMMAWFLLANLRTMDRESQVSCIAWLSGLLGIAAFSTLNPYLNGSNGIVLYCCTIAVFSTLCKQPQITFGNLKEKKGE